MTLICAVAGSPSANGQTIDFVWQGKGADVPGSISYERRRVSYPVEKGKGSVLLARRGAPNTAARIVLAANPTQSAQIAAAELRHYVAKITGVSLPIMTDRDHPFKGPKVLVGESNLTRALGLDGAALQDQEHLVRTYGDMLVLMGRDEPEYGRIDYEGNGLWPGFFVGNDWSLKPEVAKRVGTVYAVHAFLQDVCGVRWYMPGDLGEVCPQSDAVAARDLDVQARPWSLYRAIYPYSALDYFHYAGSGRKRKRISTRDLNLWLLRMKLVGVEAFNANHSIVAEWFRARFPENREILAKGYDDPTQLCLTSKALLDIVCRDADDYFAGRTNYERSYGDYFAVMPHDTSEYCHCPACQALTRDDSKTEGLGFWSDKSSNYVFNFVNEIAKCVKTKHPGRWVSCCAYARYTGVPDAFELSDNVAIELCRVLIAGFGEPEYRRYYRQLIRDWSKAVKRWTVWEYFDHIQGNYHGTSFPGVFLHELADDVRFLKAHGCRGLFNELSSDRSTIPNFAQDHLNLYVQLQLLNHAELDVDVLLDEYCRLFYGPAAEPMKAFFVRLEERYANPANWQLTDEQTDVQWDAICPMPVLKEFEELIRRASYLADVEPYGTRVRLIREAVFGMMERNCAKHFFLMKASKRDLPVPLVSGAAELGAAEGNHCARFYTINGEPTQTRTEAWVGRDAADLHVRVKCWEEDMSAIVAKVRKEDIETYKICTEDAIELFIDVGRTRKSYFQILGNTYGAVADMRRVVGENPDWACSTGVSCEAVKGADHWTITFSIPLKSLTGGTPVSKGDAWGFNICRDRPRKHMAMTENWTCWCPTGASFHEAAKFGVLKFE